MPSKTAWSITQQELDPWSVEWDKSINPTQPLYFNGLLASGNLRVVCVGAAYAGALLKNVAYFGYQTERITSAFSVRFSGELLTNGQVIEFDRKFTDNNGYTYDGSFQLNIVNGWIPQVGNPWVNLVLPVQCVADSWNTVIVEYLLDYANHTILVTKVNGVAVPAIIIPAKALGWAANKIVTQIQLCTNSKGGFYVCDFNQISISGSR